MSRARPTERVASPPPPPDAPAPPGTQRATYRGIRWQRNPDGAVGWHNPDLQRWVRWRPKAGHPPPPPRWVAAGIPSQAASTRPKWRTPYRIVPLVLVAAVCVIGILQAFKSSSNPVKAETAAAEKLLGKCLATKGTQAGHPSYAPTPVACDAPTAAVKVVKVLAPTSDAHCPAGTTAFKMSYPGVADPHVECVQPVKSS